MNDFGYSDYINALLDNFGIWDEMPLSDWGQSNPYMSSAYLDVLGGSGSQDDPYSDFGYDIHQYSGIDSDIMQSLSSAFAFEPGEGYNPSGASAAPIWGVTEEGVIGGGNAPPYIEGALHTSGNVAYEDLNLVTALPFVNIFDSASIADHLSDIYGLEGEPVRPGEITALTPEMLRKTESKHYDPYERAKRDELTEAKTVQVEGLSPGGFAGSGVYSGGLAEADMMYQEGYQDVIADILEMRGVAKDDIMDIIHGWSEYMTLQTTE